MSICKVNRAESQPGVPKIMSRFVGAQLGLREVCAKYKHAADSLTPSQRLAGLPRIKTKDGADFSAVLFGS